MKALVLFVALGVALPLGAQVDSVASQASSRAGERAEDWSAVLEALPDEQQQGLEFVLEHMPARDRSTLDPAAVADQVRLAYEARAAVSWGAALDEFLFLNAVVAPSHLNEERDLMRRELAERFLPRVKELESSGAAAHYLNQHVFPELSVKYSTARRRADQGPRESIETGLASCTGLSILLAEASRACGVPARVAGINTWPNKPGNHTWVEVWDTADNSWHHVGAAEPSAQGLDHVWFAGDAALAHPGSREHGIWAASYARTENLFPLVWLPEQDYVYALDVTERYLPQDKRADLQRLHVTVRGVTGARVEVPVALELSDPDSAQLVAKLTGTSRGERADANDFMTFELAGAQGLRLSVAGTTEEEPLPALESADQHVVRTLGSSDEELALLLAEDPSAARARIWADFAASPEHAALQADFEGGLVRTHDRESPWVAKEVGERPANGWPLVVAMHGGGGVPKEVNDSQWAHMQVFYHDHPEAGGYRYLALRAPNDAWNGFYDAAIAPLLEELVVQQVLFAGVDADRVHIIGYSHGGYGVWVLAPKVPDRLASAHASAAAPSGGESQLANLFALPFTFMCGVNDTAYGRIDRNREAASAFEALRGERTDASWYPARAELIEGKGHGGLPDRDKLVEMLPHVRDPLPREIVWHPSDNRIRDHYWMSIDHPAGGQRVHARIEGATIHIDATNVEAVTLWLDERLIGDADEVRVRTGGVEHTYPVHHSPTALRESLRRWRDPARLFTARVDVSL